MKFENTGIEEITADLTVLDDVLPQFGLIRAEQWDYDKVTYDRKFELSEGTYYLRIFGTAKEGDVGSHKAIIQLFTPVIGRHYFPHGVAYGEDENFPHYLVRRCEEILKEVKEMLNNVLQQQ